MNAKHLMEDVIIIVITLLAVTIVPVMMDILLQRINQVVKVHSL